MFGVNLQKKSKKIDNKKILFINNLIFPLIGIISVVSLLIESFKYKGFIFKHIYIHSDLLIVFTFISGVFFVLYPPKKSISFWKKRMLQLFRYIYLVLLPLALSSYFYFTFVEEMNYPNYVFTRYHIQPNLLLRVLMLLVFLALMKPLKNYFLTIQGKKETYSNQDLYKVILVFLTIMYFILNLSLFWKFVTPNVVDIARYFGASREDKLAVKMGQKYSYFYSYISLVKELTPANASILLPPQENPWQFEGNQRLVRYFLYPRTLYSAHESNILDNIDYIMLAWGSDRFPPVDPDNYGWPQQDIKSSEIYLFDLETKRIEYIKDNYSSDKYLRLGVYGLIKLD